MHNSSPKNHTLSNLPNLRPYCPLNPITTRILTQLLHRPSLWQTIPRKKVKKTDQQKKADAANAEYGNLTKTMMEFATHVQDADQVIKLMEYAEAKQAKAQANVAQAKEEDIRAARNTERKIWTAYLLENPNDPKLYRLGQCLHMTTDVVTNVRAPCGKDFKIPTWHVAVHDNYPELEYNVPEKCVECFKAMNAPKAAAEAPGASL